MSRRVRNSTDPAVWRSDDFNIVGRHGLGPGKWPRFNICNNYLLCIIIIMVMLTDWSTQLSCLYIIGTSVPMQTGPIKSWRCLACETTYNWSGMGGHHGGDMAVAICHCSWLTYVGLSRVPFMKEGVWLWKRGRLPENMRKLHDTAIRQLHCSFLAQVLVFFGVSSPSQALFKFRVHNQRLCLTVLHFHHKKMA